MKFWGSRGLSGKARVAKVEVSADGGKSWALAALQEPVLRIAVTRSAWLGNGTADRPH
jgi:sulfane dehydrogenase subunit SoxC